jgi:hypothetical protein
MLFMVKYCPKCGKENNDKANFCVSCGEPFKGIEYVKRREPAWSAGRIILVIIGAIFLLTSFGMIAGGVSIRVLQESVVDSQGYIMSGVKQVTSNSYAIVVENIDINIAEPSDPFGREITRAIGRDLGNIVTFKLIANSNNAKPVFIGLASLTDVAPYLGSVNFDQALVGEWNYNPQEPNFPNFNLVNHPGIAPSTVPNLYSYWLAHTTGVNNAVMTWGLEPGNYWLVIMNEDASRGVNVDLQMGAKAPILNTVSDVLLVFGVLIGLAGALMIYYGAIRR